jgi:general secretion pathway protein L
MKAADILNADMTTLGGWIKSGWHWWLAELQAMVPEKWRTLLALQSRVMAERSPNGLYIFYKNGRLLDHLPVREHQPVTLLLSPSQILIRNLSLPKLSAKDLRALIALDMDRLTPFGANDVLFDLQLLDSNEDARKQPLLLAILPKAAATAALDHARTSGLTPKSLKISDKIAGKALPFDFMRHGTGDSVSSAGITARQFWWATAMILLVSNIGFAILRDINETSTLQAQVELQSQAARTAQMLQRRVTTEHQRRQEIIQKLANNNILAVLENLSLRLPSGAWVQRLSLKEGRIRLIGFAANDIDILASLRRSPFLTNVQSTSSDVPTALSTGQVPFDVSATVRHSGAS